MHVPAPAIVRGSVDLGAMPGEAEAIAVRTVEAS